MKLLKFAEEPGGAEKGVESFGQGLGLDDEGEITGVESIYRNRKKSIHALDLMEEGRKKRFDEEMKRQVLVEELTSLFIMEGEHLTRDDLTSLRPFFKLPLTSL